MSNNNELLTIPSNAAQHILQGNGIVACPLMSTDDFIRYCIERGLGINRERLFRFEKIGIFSPIFRVRTPETEVRPLTLPLDKNDTWFQNGWAQDTTSIPTKHNVPAFDDRECKAYYSAFQLFHLKSVLSSMTLSFQMEGLLNQRQAAEWNETVKWWTKLAESEVDQLSTHEFRPATALLCQYISDRYFFNTQTDQRFTYITHGRVSYDRWTRHIDQNWDWKKYSTQWDPKVVEKIFSLTREKLMHAYRTLSRERSYLDPLEKWGQLVRFVSAHERTRLKDSALLADTLRSGALMLWMLYNELYKEEPPAPEEITGHVLSHFPELDIRSDVRKYLEFVSNRYHLNPQPILVLFVEGQTEEMAVKRIFREYVGNDPGKYGIEIICLKGVDNATGGKEDRFRAILRLIDYLHHHQTVTFVILDNENYATRLQREAKQAASIHHKNRFITRREYIKIWKTSFEFDNFSNSEIASALTNLTEERVRFFVAEVEECKKPENCRFGKTPGALLSLLYFKKTKHTLNKMDLVNKLFDAAFSKTARKFVGNRPILKTTHRIISLAFNNQLPTMQEVWEKNQLSSYLGKRRKTASRKRH